MIPAAAIVLLLDLLALAGRGGGSPLRWAGTLLAVAFYSLVIWCYLRRGPARATTRSITAGGPPSSPPGSRSSSRGCTARRQG